MTKTIREELSSHIYENIRSYPDCYASDLQHHLFNEDYYMIGYANCEKWLDDHNVSSWEAIRVIQGYENDHFGEVNTDLSSSENVVNMYVYILGEELLHESETLDAKWNGRLDEEDMKQIIDEIC
tara:strand:+ start:8107 stop:8481 length:375 start_codon:yes stop_codon:yes gene_type:complete